MSTKYRRLLAAAIGIAVTATALAVIPASAADQTGSAPNATTAAVTLPRDSVDSVQIKPKGITQSGDFSDAIAAWLRSTPNNSVWQNSLNDNIVTEAKLHPAVREKLNAPDKVGLSGVHADAPYGANLPGQDSSATTVPAGETRVVWTACAPGEAALGGGYRFGNAGTSESFTESQAEAVANAMTVVANEAAYYKDDALVNGSVEAPVNENLSFRPNAWAVTVHNDTADEHGVRVWVVCAKVG